MVTPDGARKLADAFDESGKFGPANVLRDLASQVEALQADAARYRWERQNPAWETESFLGGLSPKEYDAAIDEAMKNDKDIRTETPT